MLSRHADKLAAMTIPISTGWLLADCMEAKGKQDLWMQQKPEVLEALREQAMVQSVESSNRIEGVTVPRERLRPVVLGKARPRDRSEQELAGYRKALDWIFSRKRPVHLSPSVILHLHKLAQGTASADAGHWKQRDNEIIEILPNGERRVRFRPTSAKKTPEMTERLCSSFLDATGSRKLPPLLVIGTCVFDFLCIHPFRDGNGRVSRLLTTHLLRLNGFQVGRYVSLERLIEESQAEYYQVLAECSQNWHKEKNEIIPWWNYFLGILHRAYQDFGQQMEQAHSHPAKTELIRRVVLAQVGSFTLSDVTAQLPFASPQLVKKVLTQLKQAGTIRLAGRGRGARWEVMQGGFHPPHV